MLAADRLQVLYDKWLNEFRRRTTLGIRGTPASLDDDEAFKLFWARLTPEEAVDVLSLRNAATGQGGLGVQDLVERDAEAASEQWDYRGDLFDHLPPDAAQGDQTMLDKFQQIGQVSKGTRLRVTAPMRAHLDDVDRLSETDILYPGTIIEVVNNHGNLSFFGVATIDGQLEGYVIRYPEFTCLEVIEVSK